MVGIYIRPDVVGSLLRVRHGSEWVKWTGRVIQHNGGSEKSVDGRRVASVGIGGS